jgi:type VI secretion system protein VasG
MFGESQVRTGHLLVGMLKTQSLRNALFGMSKQFEKIKVDDLADNFAKICWRLAGSADARHRRLPGGGGAPAKPAAPMAPAAMGKQEALKKFTVDLTEQARSGKMDPIVGPRRRDPPDGRHPDAAPPEQPDLIGEAGVGKTAVVEGFAQRIARGDVPPR